MQPINRILIGFIAFCATLGAALGIFLYISLLPHITLIGWIVAALVALGLGCTGALMFTFTLHKIGHWRIHTNVVAVGEVVAVRNEDGTWTHLSAQHVAAGVPRMLPAPKDEALVEPDEQDIIDVYNDGHSTLEQIAESFGLKYHRIQRIIADAKKHGLIHRK